MSEHPEGIELRPAHEVLVGNIGVHYQDINTLGLKALCGILREIKIPDDELIGIEQKLIDIIIEHPFRPDVSISRVLVEEVKKTIQEIRSRRKRTE